MAEPYLRPNQFSSHYLEQLIESSPDMVIAVDRVGTIVYYNDGAERTLGYQRCAVMSSAAPGS